MRRILAAAIACALGAASEARRITWADTAPLHPRLEAAGITSSNFSAFADREHQANVRRIRQGDLDHLIFYALQSTHVTSLPPIEPALSAQSLVDNLDNTERETFLKTGTAPRSRIPASARARLSAFLRAVESSDSDRRLAYFRDLVGSAFPVRRDREAALLGEYLRVMQFVYEKEFVAQRSPHSAESVAELYRTRGLSTDTAVESGYLVYLGLGVVKSLEPDRQIRRVLIVGPGLDLAPRTAMLEVGPPESYQPWAVIDALFALGLSRASDLEVVAADINPRVVAHVRRSHAQPPALILVSEIGESGTARLSEDFAEYFARLGSAIGDVEDSATTAGGHRRKTVRVHPSAARVLRSEPLDIVTERLDEAPFDVIIATNILPYFNDVELTLALSNITGMLAPGGMFLHNEPRPAMLDLTATLGVPFLQSRQSIIAAARPAPLVDVVWLHRKAAGS